MLLHLFCFTAGGARGRASLALTKTLALVCDIAPGRWSYVPALMFQCCAMNLRNGQAVPMLCFAVIV